MEKSKIDILERHFVKFILEKRKVKNGLKEATSMIALDETNFFSERTVHLIETFLRNSQRYT